MLNIFTEGEKAIVADLVQKGLKDASSSLTTLVSSPVKVDRVDFGIMNILRELPKIGTGDSLNFKVLKSELVGDISGTSILVLNNSDVLKIAQSCIPEEVEFENDIDQKIMTDELLKEIDNIISAAVTNVFANELKVSLHGDVPQLYQFDPEQLNMFVTNELSKHGYVIHFKANLKILELDLCPDFIWILEKPFINQIKKIKNRYQSEKMKAAPIS